MKTVIVPITFLCGLLLGCATLSEQAKMEEYGRTMDAYEAAMRVSDFNAACQYMDPAALGREDCVARYDNLKLVSYDILRVHVAEDKQEVTHAVEAHYYFLDRHILKTIQYEQLWRYEADLQAWMLQTGPPHFK